MIAPKEIAKFVIQNVRCPTDLFSLVSSDRTRMSGSKPCQGMFRLDMREHFFTKRVLKHWNRLSGEVVDAPSLLVLKGHLDNALNML